MCESRSISEWDWEHGFDLTPINAYSNFAYFIVGNYFIASTFGHGSRDPSTFVNQFSKYPIWPLLLGSCFVTIGYASYSYHASYSNFGIFMDYSNIVMTLGFLTHYLVVSMFLDGPGGEALDDSISPQLAVGGLIANLLIAYSAMYIFGLTAVYMMMALYSSVALYAFFKMPSEMKDTHYLEYAMGAGVLALIGFELSPDFPYCDEDSLFQFHAMWHLMSAVAMLFMGLYLYEGHGIDFSDDYFEV